VAGLAAEIARAVECTAAATTAAATTPAAVITRTLPAVGVDTLARPPNPTFATALRAVARAVTSLAAVVALLETWNIDEVKLKA